MNFVEVIKVLNDSYFDTQKIEIEFYSQEIDGKISYRMFLKNGKKALLYYFKNNYILYTDNYREGEDFKSFIKLEHIDKTIEELLK